MDDYLLDSLGRALVALSVNGPGLDALLFPRRGAGGDSGKPPAKRDSKPPVSLPILDLKKETEDVLGTWCGALSRAVPEHGRVPAGASIAERADWLRSRIPVIESMPWANRCAEEIIVQAGWVSDVVAPPGEVNDPSPIEYGTARELASWTQLLGRPVSRSTIRRAIAEERIPSEITPEGKVLARLADVLELAGPVVKLGLAHPSC